MRTFCLNAVVLCAVLTSGSAGAWAEQGRWYAGIKAGAGGGADVDVTGLPVPYSYQRAISPVVMGTAGYAFGNGVRLEGEASWRTTDFEVDLPGLGTSDLGVRNLAFMVNGGYAFLDHSFPAIPFLLGGIGVSLVEGTAKIRGISGDETQTKFAYQGGAGLLIPLGQSLELEISYRYFATREPTYTVMEGTEITEINAKVDNTHHNGLVGLAYRF